MYLQCKKCNKKYLVPDFRLDNRRVYFHCENCGHRIIVDRQKDRFFKFKALSSGVLTLKDILDGIYLSFNLKNVLIAFFYLLFNLAFLVSAGYLLYRNMDKIASYKHELMVIGGGALLFLMYCFDLFLYLISKNVFHRIRTGINIKFTEHASEFFNDQKSIFFFSAGLILILLLLMLPVRISHEYFIMHAALLFPVFALLILVIMVVLFSNVFVCAFIAAKSRSMIYTIRSFFKFLAVENINIPIYIFIVNILSSGISLLFFTLASVITYVLAGAYIAYAGQSIMGTVMKHGVPKTPAALMEMLTVLTQLPASTKASLVIFAGMFLLTLLFIASYFLNLAQTLSAAAVQIMESNPGRSVSRVGVIICLLIIFGIIGFFSFGLVLSAVPALKLMKL